MTLEQLKAEEKELNEKLRTNKKLQQTILEADLILRTGMNVGDKIEYRGAQMVIVGIKLRYLDEPDFDCRLILKDGSLGKLQKWIYGFEVPTVKIIQKNFINPEDFQLKPEDFQ